MTATTAVGADVLLARTCLLRVAEPAPHLARFVEAHGAIAAAELIRAAAAPGPVLDKTTARRTVDLAERGLPDADDVAAALEFRDRRAI